MRIFPFRFWVLDFGFWNADFGFRISHWGVRSVVCALVVLACCSRAVGGARVEGDWIVVTGRANTLESVAREVNDPAVLSFDEEMGAATAAKSFRIEGELRIGGPRTGGEMFRYVNSLEFDIGRCGQARIVIQNPKSGEGNPTLLLENARIGALRTEQGNDACKAEGNPLELAAGSLVIRRSQIAGNFVVRAHGGNLEIADSLIATSNHTGVVVGNVASAQIAALRSLDHQIYGMEIGPCDRPLVLDGCTIRGGGADLHVRGRTEVVARDCDFDSIRFAGEGGSVRRQWTLTVRAPSAGCRVVAQSEKGCALAETVEAAADTSGIARLILTEYVARAGGADYLRAGENDTTPHRLTIYSPDGAARLLEIARYRVLTRGQEVRVP
ncbi:MAG: hypothetical protein N3D11_17600 [Candidatus Sumerlaeia bacterium]|nr:hypothetical protein [Candidatus Sumerlaeia bacterium]